MLGIAAFLTVAAATVEAAAPPPATIVEGRSSDRRGGDFALIAGGIPSRVLADSGADEGVRRAASDLGHDLASLGGRGDSDRRRAVIVGVLGHDLVIDRLVAAGRIDVRRLSGAWEGFIEQVVDRPAPGIDRALVIVGSDRRGAIFGAYDVSRRAGVSPWTWWADVPVPHRPDLAVTPGARFDKPAVKYRGIFLNDEDPALSGWAKATFGGLNHAFYERLFQLVLRLKSNTVWPAMWGKSLWDDDPESAAVADRMGIVLGTSHHEPLLRAHVEWERYGKGPWDYTVNAERLQAFWREGLVRNGTHEALVTIGMRGDGDKPMTQGTAIPLLERIVADQRRIIGEVSGKPPAATPQVWALYKEV